MLLVVLGLILCALTALYVYVRQRNNYWQRCGITTLKTNFFFGYSFDFLTGRRPTEEIHHDIYKAAPNEPYVGVYDIRGPVLFIRDPDLIHRVTVKDFNNFHHRGEMVTLSRGYLVYNLFSLHGEEWRTVRNKLKPTFSGSKMRNMFQLIEGCAKMLVETHFRPVAQTTKPIEVQEIMTRYTLDVLGCCAFGLQFNTLNDSDSFFRKIAKIITDFYGLRNTIFLAMRLLTPNLVRWLGIKQTRAVEVEKFFFDLLHQAEEVRRKETEHRGDFLQLMLDIRDREDGQASHLFTDNHIVSNMFAFYFAGHETISNALSFALYELAIHPEIQDKLRSEIKMAKTKSDGILDYSTVKKIVYLEMVISEILRLHSPVGVNARACTETYQLPGSSYKVRPGDKILYSIRGLHRDEKYFPNPEKFDPERFSAENIAQRNPHVFQPFGSGPRICLGERFAILEMKICLVHILLRYKLSGCSKTEIPVILNPKSVFHTAKNGIWLSIEEIGS